jgi:hypothetical protein
MRSLYYTHFLMNIIIIKINANELEMLILCVLVVKTGEKTSSKRAVCLRYLILNIKIKNETLI